MPNRINADLYPGPNIDITFDLMRPWPFADGSISAVHANHVLEHVPDPLFFMGEAWRVLARSETNLKTPNLHIRVPYGPSEHGIGDVTHLRIFSPTTWACWSPGYYEMTGNPQHKSMPLFGCLMCALRVEGNLAWLMKPWFRRIGFKILPHLWGAYAEMHVKMIKITEDQVSWWKSQPENAYIPVSRIMFEDEYYGRSPSSERRYLCLD